MPQTTGSTCGPDWKGIYDVTTGHDEGNLPETVELLEDFIVVEAAVMSVDFELAEAGQTLERHEQFSVQRAIACPGERLQVDQIVDALKTRLKDLLAFAKSKAARKISDIFQSYASATLDWHWNDPLTKLLYVFRKVGRCPKGPKQL